MDTQTRQLTERSLFGLKAVATAVLAVAVLLVFASVWAHLPGQVSMDASMQLYEASIAKSVTWNPPYMTAILRWLGGGPTASSWMVVVNSAFTYLSFAFVGVTVLLSRHREKSAFGNPSTDKVFVWCRAIGITLVIVNPIVFLYVGIVWKDVLFSTLMLVGVALGLVACLAEARKAIILAAISAIVLAIAMKVRQQGIFMSPVLLLVPIIAVTSGRDGGWKLKTAKSLCLVAVFIASSLAMSALVARTIETDARFGNSVGYRGLMQYDIAGIIALSDTPTDQLAVPMTDVLRGDIRRLYTADRGDFLWQSPAVTQWQSLPSYDGIKRRWFTLIRSEPQAFLKHKLGAYAAILSVDGVKACLPMHVGIDGNHEYLRAIGFAPGVDGKDRYLYGVSQTIIRWPIYRHWVYLVALVVGVIALGVARMDRRLRAAAFVVATATFLLYLSYLPTSIACDFRYLYAAICLVSLLWIVVIGAGRWQRRVRPSSAAGTWK